MSDSKQAVIGPRSEVLMHFSLSLPDGMVAESTFDDEPFRFTLGDGSVVAGLEEALIGLRPGERRSVRIDPENAFGHHDPDNVHELSRDTFPEDMDLQPGQIIAFTTPAGDELPGAILEVGGETVTVDLNHPLAGREITFEVEILEVKPGRSDA